MADPIKSKRSKASRRRGRRGEIVLRNYLRALGWEADRVPGSGAFEKLPGDVTAKKGERFLKFEVKNHSGTFDSLYTLYNEHVKTAKDDVLSFAMPHAKHLCVSVSTSLDALFDGPDWYTIDYRHDLYAEHTRAFKKIGTIQAFLKEADILVLKDDRKPFLFLRYR